MRKQCPGFRRFDTDVANMLHDVTGYRIVGDELQFFSGLELTARFQAVDDGGAGHDH